MIAVLFDRAEADDQLVGYFSESETFDDGRPAEDDVTSVQPIDDFEDGLFFSETIPSSL